MLLPCSIVMHWDMNEGWLRWFEGEIMTARAHLRDTRDWLGLGFGFIVGVEGDGSSAGGSFEREHLVNAV